MSKRLEPIAAALGDAKELRKATRLGECAVALRDALPARYTGAVEAAELARDVLVAKVENPVFLEELGLMRRDLVAAANRNLRLPLRDILFRLGEVDRVAALTVAEEGTAPLPEGTGEAAREAAAACGDPELAGALGRAFESLARRRAALAAEGFTECPACGELLAPGAARCPGCAKARARAVGEAVRFFRGRPAADAAAFKAAGFAGDLYAPAKARLAAGLRARLEETAADPRALGRELRLYLSLVEGRPVEEATPELLARHFDPPHAARLAGEAGPEEPERAPAPPGRGRGRGGKKPPAGER